MSFNDASKRLDIALESLFDAEQTTAAMLDKVRTNVANTVCSIEDARVLENKLSEEAAQFNECLTTMSEAIRKYEAGNISSDDMLAECTPCATALRERCVALKLSGVKVTGNDITEEEIATLREFIVGCKDIVAERVEELQDCCGEEGCEHEGAQESILGNMLFGDPRAAAIRNSPELKTANELYKQAKKLYGVGNKERAQECLAKAKKIYEAKYALAVKEARMVTSTRKGTTWNPNAKISDEYKKKITENASLGAIVLYLEDKVDSCTALKMQWENKAGKNSYAETKAQLKAERVEERKKYRAAKKAEKQKEETSMESTYTNNEALDIANEAYNDYIMYIATEGQNLDARRLRKNYGKEIRLAGKQAKQLYKAGQYPKAKAAYMKASGIVDDMIKEIDALEPSTGSAYLGYIAHSLKTGVTVLIPFYGIVVAIREVMRTVESVIMGLNKISKGETLSSSDFNVYVTRLKQSALRLQKGFKKMADKCGKGESLAGDGATESFLDGVEGLHPAYESYVVNLEAFMDSLETEYGAAMEAEGETAETAKGSKLRALLNKFKKAKVEGNTSEAARTEREIRETVDDIKEEAAEAETEAEVKKSGKSVVIALGAVAALAAVGGAAMIAKKRDDQSNRTDIAGINKLLVTLGNQMERGGTNAKGAIKKGADALSGAISKQLNRFKKVKVIDDPGAGRTEQSALPAPKQLALPAGAASESVASTFRAFESMLDEDFSDEDGFAAGKEFDDDDAFDDEAIEAMVAGMLAEDDLED